MKAPCDDIDEGYQADIVAKFGERGKKALDAIRSQRVKKYRDFFLVESKTKSYIVDDDFCTCCDFLYRRSFCWHRLTVMIALETGLFEVVDTWFYETFEPPHS